jgi:hypothetical protein
VFDDHRSWREGVAFSRARAAQALAGQRKAIAALANDAAAAAAAAGTGVDGTRRGSSTSVASGGNNAASRPKTTALMELESDAVIAHPVRVAAKK